MPSTAWANVGYSATCDNGAVMGTTGRNGKAIAETRCAHKVLVAPVRAWQVSVQALESN